MLKDALTWSSHRSPSPALFPGMSPGHVRSCSVPTGPRGPRRRTPSRRVVVTDLLGACYMHELRAELSINVNSLNAHKKSRKQVQFMLLYQFANDKTEEQRGL